MSEHAHWLRVENDSSNQSVLAQSKQAISAVASEQVTTDQGRAVPATGVTEKLAGVNLDKLFRVGFDHAENSGASQNDEFVTGQENTTVTVLVSPPFQLAVGCIEASE